MNTIKANELRIGNHILHDGAPVTVLQIEGRWVKVKQYISEERYDVELDDTAPIPLTPEILEKCGFERKTDYAVGIGLFDYYQVNGFSLNWIDQSKCWVVFSGVNRITIKNLHQLTNLYYALTGEELEYKP